MIYCPHCKKPSAKESGPCPHCGQDLNGLEERAPAAKASSGDEARNEFEMDDDDGGEIELAGDDYRPPIEYQPAIPSQGGVARGPRELSSEDDGPSLQVIEDTPPPMPVPAVVTLEIGDAEVREKGGFGPRPDGIAEVAKYWFKVRGRLKELSNERVKAEEECRANGERLEVLRAQLGREAHADKLCSDSMQHMVSHALKLEANLQSLLSRKAGMAAQHEQSLRSLEVTRREIEAQMAPVREQETAASLRFDSARTDFQREEARAKRAEIELRNVVQLIEQRQADYSDLEKPKEERDALLAKIAELDKQQPPIHARIKEHRGKVAELAGPMAEAEADLEEVRGRLGVLGERITAVRKEMEKLEALYSQSVGSVAREVDDEKRGIQKGWATVGERVLQERLHEGSPLEARGKIALTATETALSAERKRDLIDRAMIAYDKEAFTKARNMGIGAIVVLGLAVAAILVVATI